MNKKVMVTIGAVVISALTIAGVKTGLKAIAKRKEEDTYVIDIEESL